ncbi:MAG: glycosyl transferase group 1, partial [Acidimicrobiales bacterium]|nr:glycosyl transferase group 1 [Acidimicrobiales bacterium]
PRAGGRLLVIAPHATRSGSTTVLLHLLRGSAAAGGPPLAVELLSGGPMAGDLARFGAPLASGEEPRAVLANSALAAGALHRFGPDVPVATYLHESGEVLATLPPDARSGILRSSLVLCVSPNVLDGAVAMGVDPARTVLLPPVVADRARPPEAEVDEARRRAGAGAGDRLVLGCGEARWAKGADLFVDVARLLPATDVRFAWVGRRIRAFGRQLDHDVAAAGLEDRVRWVDEVPDVSPFLAGADVLLVASRDDAQPLVPLEAGLLGTPTVGFAVGGLRDLADAGAALVAPYPDSAAVAALIGRLLAEPETAAAAAAAARRRVQERQAAPVVVPGFVAAMEALLGGGPLGPDW